MKVYKIMHEQRGWCVAVRNDSDGYWHRVSNLYRFRGWAQNFARRMKLNVINYESYFA